MTKLEKIIFDHINDHGPLPFHQFMEWCMRHPDFGYYITRDPLGQHGDFTTGPEISQMFGEMIALWCVDYWIKMGEPQDVVLCEAGPGRGTLMDDVLRTIKAAPAFGQAARIVLIEKSPALQKKQAEKLKAYNITWISELSDLLNIAGNAPIIMFCNELFDTFAIRRFTKLESGWAEQAVTVIDEKLAFTRLPPNASHESLFKDDCYKNAAIGAIAEFSPDCMHWMDQFSALLAQQKGAALIIDYGYEGPACFDTVQAIAAKKFCPILDHPGEADITGFVDFSIFRQRASGAGLSVPVLRNQRDFLMNCGILQRASLLKAKASAEQQKKIDVDLTRLISGEEMGLMFKVFCMHSSQFSHPIGF